MMNNPPVLTTCIVEVPLRAGYNNQRVGVGRGQRPWQKLAVSWKSALASVLALVLAVASTPASAKTQSFTSPSVRGVRLDWCAHFGIGCGKTAADFFCQQNGFSTADRFTIDENVGRRGVATLVLGDNRLCRGPTCSGFRVIICSRADVAASPPPDVVAAPSQPTPNTRPNVAILPTPPLAPQPFAANPLSAPPPPPGSSPQVQSKRQVPSNEFQSPGTSAPANVAPISPQLMTRLFCIANPLSCCPPGASITNGCRMVAQALLDIRVRSYVPPRFITMGNNLGNGPDWAMADVVSDVKLDGPYKVWPGCRFDVNSANHAIDDSKSIIQKAGELAEAWLGQWSSGVEAAKSFVADGIADQVCSGVDNTQSCRSNVAGAVKTGINAGLTSLGIPPEIPDVQQLRQNGIEYLAAEGASYAVGQLDVLKQLPIDDALREQLYQGAYDKAANVIATNLNKVLPPANFDADHPETWGHIDPVYAPHNAHLYIEVRIKPGMYPTYLKFIVTKPGHKWPLMYVNDLSYIYAGMGPIDIPAFIPPKGIILPLELKPHDLGSAADKAPTQIPGIKISNEWLKTKFFMPGYSPPNGLVTAQANYQDFAENGYTSDWDLFFGAYATHTANFRVTMVAGSNPGTFDWVNDLKFEVGHVWDADTGIGATADFGHVLKNYYGRLDPAPYCDGTPNSVDGS